MNKKPTAEQDAVQAAQDRVNELAQARAKLIADIARLEQEQPAASVERLRQIAGELRDARDALPSLDGQIDQARQALALAQHTARQAQIDALRPREAAAFGEAVRAAEAMQAAIDGLRAVGRDITDLGGQIRVGVPLSMVNAVAQFVERASKPPEPSPAVSNRQRRAAELRASLQRAYRLRAEIGQRLNANDHAAQNRRQEVKAWIKRDESALRALGEELPEDEQPPASPVSAMTPQQADIFEQMRQRIAEVQNGG